MSDIYNLNSFPFAKTRRPVEPLHSIHWGINSGFPRSIFVVGEALLSPLGEAPAVGGGRSN